MRLAYFFFSVPEDKANLLRMEAPSGSSLGSNVYLPGTVSLLEDLDKTLMVLLRDGRVLIGILRSIDQFANLVLHRTIERIHVGKKYGDIPRGVFIVRGENVVLLGEYEESREGLVGLQKVGIDEIIEIQREDLRAKKDQEDRRIRTLRERGLLQYSLFDNAQNDDY
ncbi:U6 snRNA-associated Sm-like protein LSm1 [Galendromus occidentalis]|uniref:U6 snRNA-associated Sm-like protein LSm1 n=1 Tax=Galendromus occidentalis TaxID=34638 RepID=A0AAJ6QVA1_9ACAR|nr:U6 snRNA-associated Sm-like protein LSm1 [Galendromus occidentalis]